MDRPKSNPTLPDKIALRVPEASQGLSRSKLYELIGERKLPSVKAGGRRLILRSDLEAYLAACRDVG
jgi:excisionase family DNA binding protein